MRNRWYTLPPLVALALVLAVACSGPVTGPLAVDAEASPLSNHNENVCPDGSDGWTKIDNQSGGASGDWGSFSYAGTLLEYEVEAGWTLQLCLKSGAQVGREFHTLDGATSGEITIAQQFSHVSWRVFQDTEVFEDLEVVKTANGHYDVPVAWTLEKKVASGHVGADAEVDWEDLLEFAGAPGDLFQWTYRVIATRVEGDRENFRVTGTITITNPNDFAVDVTIADELLDVDDATIAAVDVFCPGEALPNVGTVGANDSIECTYEANVLDDAAVLNFVIVTPDHEQLLPVDADAAIEFEFDEYTGDTEVQLEDEEFAYDEVIDETTTVTFQDSFTCPMDVDRYENGTCFEEFENVATLSGEETDLEDDARVEITCVGIYGCTPGFWKNQTGQWTSYTTGQALQTVFDGNKIVNGLKTETLLAALDFGGGSGAAGAQRILFRAAVASLLNLAHPDVAFIVPATNGSPAITTTAQLIALVNSTLSTQNSGRAAMVALAERLDAANNAVNLCSLDADNARANR